ncbi:methionine biosynthesis protein MetW [Ignavibacterium album]|uniref:methionine biosynthesis protein MetW n=1 Tax=Ignavibacterium album TaxID=591197 RepID=UPI0035B9ED48
MMNIDKAIFNDNRNYNYSGFEEFERPDYSFIVELVEENSRVVDLGCGNGSLMQILIRKKKVAVKGVEISESGVAICKQKGLDVIQGKIDNSLPFNDNEFDYSICHITIQMVMYPEVLLQEMKRISRYQIISFPNFAFYKNRLELFFKGRMPRKMLFGYNWFNTGHIHQLSFKDFIELINCVGNLEIQRISFIKSNSIKDHLIQIFPNLLMQFPIFLLTKNEKTYK